MFKIIGRVYRNFSQQMFNVLKLSYPMKTHEESPNKLSQLTDIPEQNDFEGYPLYPEEEDIFFKARKGRKLNPVEVTNFILPEQQPATKKSLTEDLIVDDMDLLEVEPDEEVLLGIDDEENRYYSLGGDDHIDLEEENLGE